MIYDCTIIHNELDLLRFRMDVLSGVADKFVVVESDTTHSGKPKPTHLHGLDDRVIPITVTDMPAGDSWTRIAHQRQAIMRGLSGASDDDVVLMSDIDEIPDPKVVANWKPGSGPNRLQQLFGYYWANCVGGHWYGTRILTAGDMRRIGSVEAVRHGEYPIIDDAGWHFSYLGGPRQVREKLASFTHTDLDIPPFNDPKHIEFVSSLGIDLFLRPGMKFDFVPVDERFPDALKSEAYRHWTKDALFHEEWYPNDQLVELYKLASRVRDLPGVSLEIGAWEGRSTIALSHAVHPAPLFVVDTWEGEPRDGTDRIAKERNVYDQFYRNASSLSAGNLSIVKKDWSKFLSSFRQPIKFAHVDGPHDYESVVAMLRKLKPMMTDGGIVCGDDIIAANVGRKDLGGGVERAVREEFPAYKSIGNLWWYQ